MFSGIWRKAKKKNTKKERKFGLKEFPRPLVKSNGGCMATVTNTVKPYTKDDIDSITPIKRSVNSDNATQCESLTDVPRPV